jgi:hypothetical protein
MAFDFFNISGSLFVEDTDSKNRSSAQGLFMMMMTMVLERFWEVYWDGLLINILQNHLIILLS